MDRLAAMQAFVRVVESGSFSAVARTMGSTQSAVSKQVAALESYLGAKLLSRTTRALSLTDEGRAYFESSARLVRELEEAELALRAGEGEVLGRLRVGAGVGFGRQVLFSLVRDFMQAHPALQVDLQLNDGFVDLVGEGLDVAIRVGELGDSSLLAQRVGITHRAVVASRVLAAQLSEQHCLPVQPADLAQHNCIVYTGLATRNQWAFDAMGDSPAVSVPVQGRLSSNSSEVVRDAVLAGLGLGFSPTWLFSAELRSGDVVRLMPQFSPHPLPINAIYPPSRRHSAKVSAFVQRVREGLAGLG
jgi:DNA-binding transcriptional LysR family regulator